jgi:hypothetical protein
MFFRYIIHGHRTELGTPLHLAHFHYVIHFGSSETGEIQHALQFTFRAADLSATVEPLPFGLVRQPV